MLLLLDWISQLLGMLFLFRLDISVAGNTSAVRLDISVAGGAFSV